MKFKKNYPKWNYRKMKDLNRQTSNESVVMSDGIPVEKIHQFSPNTITTYFLNTTDRVIYTKDPYTGALQQHPPLVDTIKVMCEIKITSADMKELRQCCTEVGLYIINVTCVIDRYETKTAGMSFANGGSRTLTSKILKSMIYVENTASCNGRVRVPRYNNLLVNFNTPFTNAEPSAGIYDVGCYSKNTESLIADKESELVVSVRVVDNANIGKEYFINIEGQTNRIVASGGPEDGLYTQVFPDAVSIGPGGEITNPEECVMRRVPLIDAIYTSDDDLKTQTTMLYESRIDARKHCSDYALRTAQAKAEAERVRLKEADIAQAKLDNTLYSEQLKRESEAYKAQVEIASFSRKASAEKLTTGSKIAVGLTGITATVLAFVAKNAIFASSSITAAPLAIGIAAVTGICCLVKSAWNTFKSWFH